MFQPQLGNSQRWVREMWSQETCKKWFCNEGCAFQTSKHMHEFIQHNSLKQLHLRAIPVLLVIMNAAAVVKGEMCFHFIHIAAYRGNVLVHFSKVLARLIAGNLWQDYTNKPQHPLWLIEDRTLKLNVCRVSSTCTVSFGGVCFANSVHTHGKREDKERETLPWPLL